MRQPAPARHVLLASVLASVVALSVAPARAQPRPAPPPQGEAEGEYQLSIPTETREAEAIRVREARRAELTLQADILRDLAIAGAAVAIAGVISIGVVAADRASDPCVDDCDDLSDYGPGIGVTVVGGAVVLVGGIVSAVLYTFASDLAKEIEALREQVEPEFSLLPGGASFSLRVPF